MESTTEVFYWGADKCGQFGMGDRFSIQIKKLSCGDEHTAFIATNGYLYTMGSNSFGKLGTSCPSQHYSPRPVLIESLLYYQIVDISCGYHHTGAVTTSGMVFTWGQGSFGQLGLKEPDCSWAPAQVLLQYSALKISCGNRHTAAILENSGKNLSMWGAGESGQLGLGARDNSCVPTLAAVGPVKDVACGAFHTVLLTAEGEVYCAGANTFGQLGTGNKEGSSVFLRLEALRKKEVTRVAAGQHSGCVTAAGELFVWGSFSLGEFLTPYRLECPNKVTGIGVGIGYGMALDRNGGMWSWGALNSNYLAVNLELKPQLCPVVELQGKRVEQLACGAGFVMALGSDIERQEHRTRREAAREHVEMNTCLEEMRKEIARLQKGAGGLEDLSCKLEQSKIKQGHLHSLYVEEMRQKKIAEEALKGAGAENRSMAQRVQEGKERAEKRERVILGLEEEVGRKKRELEEIQQKLDVTCRHNAVLSEEIKEIPVLLNRILGMENKCGVLEKEKGNLSIKVIECLEENTKLMQKIEKLQQEVLDKNKIAFELHEKSEQLLAERNKNSEFLQKIEKLNLKLSDSHTRITSLNESYSSEIEQYKESLRRTNEELNELHTRCKEQTSIIKHLQDELALTTSNLETNLHSKLKLEKKLSQQQNTNKEIINTIEKELHSRAETIKSMNIPLNKKKFSSTFYEHSSDTFR